MGENYTEPGHLESNQRKMTRCTQERTDGNGEPFSSVTRGARNCTHLPRPAKKAAPSGRTALAAGIPPQKPGGQPPSSSYTTSGTTDSRI